MQEERLRELVVKWRKQSAIFKFNYGDSEVEGAYLSCADELEQALADAPTEPHPAEMALEHDRTLVAECVTRIKKELESYQWLTEGRGSYEWDDDRWMEEFKTARKAIREALEPMVKIAADWSNCPKKWDDVQKARAAAPQSDWVEWIEPAIDSDPVYCRVPKATAIKMQRNAALNSPKHYVYPNDEQALEDFMTVHWATAAPAPCGGTIGLDYDDTKRDWETDGPAWEKRALEAEAKLAAAPAPSPLTEEAKALATHLLAVPPPQCNYETIQRRARTLLASPAEQPSAPAVESEPSEALQLADKWLGDWIGDYDPSKSDWKRKRDDLAGEFAAAVQQARVEALKDARTAISYPNLRKADKRFTNRYIDRNEAMEAITELIRALERPAERRSE